MSLHRRLEILRIHMIAENPGQYNYEQLYDRLFNNPSRNNPFDETPYRALFGVTSITIGGAIRPGWLHSSKTAMASRCRLLGISSKNFNTDLENELEEVQARKAHRAQVKQWKTKSGILRVKKSDPADAMPIS